MENSSEKNNSIWNTILTLVGIAAGAILITKLTHQETSGETVIKESDPISKPKEKHLEPKTDGVNNRQQTILAAVKEKGMITPKELQQLLPEISTRTLRRDMDALAKAKLVSQKGSTKSTFYKYIGR